MKVFLLQHVHSFDNCEEDVKLIGIYSSRANAEAAVTRLSQAPGFSTDAAGFHVDEYVVDNDHWIEGYSTLANA
ncbi:MAG TPA: hypothetical protein VF278_13040 [Pirellulales bacterium]